MRALSRFALLAVVALGLACTKTNPRYCGDGGYTEKDCKKPKDAGVAEVHDAASEAAEVADATDVAEASADVATDGTDTAEAKAVCSSDPECGDGGTPACETRDGGARCVECTKNTHCGSAKPICDTTTDTCVECNGVDSTMECKDSSKSACDTTKRVCVQCVNNKTCGGATPICDLPTNKCRTCAADKECAAIPGGPGVCVDWDGHCATSAETITLQSNVGCTPSPADFSFCKSSDASGAFYATPGRSVLVVKGPAPVAAIDIPPGALAPRILVVGQGGATIGAGAGDVAGVHVFMGNKAWVRDLAIGGGTTGVVVDGPTELHLTRCVITHNDKGGIRTTNASFDITNTIIAANGAGSDVGGVTFGGVRLGNIPANGFSNFANNTVVDNMLIGVSCATSYDVSTSIVFNNVGANTANCAGASCCGATNPDPMLDLMYRLKLGSPCIDKITATTSTVTVDIDQQPRPTPPTTAKLDCGADEFTP